MAPRSARAVCRLPSLQRALSLAPRRAGRLCRARRSDVPGGPGACGYAAVFNRNSIGIQLNPTLYQDVLIDTADGTFDTEGGSGMLVLIGNFDTLHDTTPGAQGNYVIAADGAADTIVASAGNTQMTVAGGGNVIGLAGNSKLYTTDDPAIAATSDTIVAGAGNVTAGTASGNDLVAGSGNETLSGIL